jgi:hypothetical protein
LATTLCRPLASEVKKLFVTDNKNRTDGLVSDFDYPVNDFTWPDIAKNTVISRAYEELGTAKTEQTYTVRGQGPGAFGDSKLYVRERVRERSEREEGADTAALWAEPAEEVLLCCCVPTS